MRKGKVIGWLQGGMATLAALLLCLGTAGQAGAQMGQFQDYGEQFTKAIQGGKFSGSFRFSYEYSDLKDPARHHPASGFNVRTRLNYKSAAFYGVSGFIQLQNVSNIEEDFNDAKGSAQKNRDVIADPDGSRVHQGYLDLGFLPKTHIKIGRQEIILDDHRLVGNIGWRQNAQSFDGVTVTSNIVKGLTLFGGYVDRVNTILLEQKDLDGFWMFHATYGGIQGMKLSAFCYLLNSEGGDKNDRDLATYGLRATGKVMMIRYALDYAYQTDWNDRDYDVSANMFNGYLAADLNKMISIGAGISYIEGQDDKDPKKDRAFDTLFSTAHKFNGWADDFLGTNGGKLVDGLIDYYGDLTVHYFGAKFKVVYHYFDNQTDDATKGKFDDAYGDEWDALAVKKLYRNVKGLIKYAHYNERNSSGRYAKLLGLVGGHDEDVFWTRLMISF